MTAVPPDIDAKPRHDGIRAVRDVIRAAKPVGGDDMRARLKLLAGREIVGENPAEWEPDEFGLPPDCPVQPLGVADDVAFLIDPIGQVRAIKPPCGKTHIVTLFSGLTHYLEWAWPRWGKKGVDSFAADEVFAALMHACALKGPWSAVDKVRGRGAWRDETGDIIMHLGTHMMTSRRVWMPGQHEGYVYPTSPPLPHPWPRGDSVEGNPGKILRTMLSTWRWHRPEVDPQLLLGWIGAAFLGGALDWRPAVFITGDRATGKSTLQSLIKRLFGEWLVQAVDTSAAGIYQHVGRDCIPVAVDEFEAERETSKQKAVLHLMRQAASGGLMLRGGDRHVGVQFRARNCFLFSSINAPPLPPQDLSRLALLRLKKLPADRGAPSMAAADMRTMGRVILRRLMEQWQRFDVTLAAFRAELAAGGMDGRGQDTFGTLLACADLIEHDGWDEDRLIAPYEGDMRPWREILAAATMAEFEDQAENWRLCLAHMLSTTVDAWRTTSVQTAGQILEQYYRNTGDMDLSTARKLLGRAGLGLWKPSGGDAHRPMWLAVPNQGSLTRTLFEGTKWAGDPGAGVWAGALRQADIEGFWQAGRAKVNGVGARATLISIEALYGEHGVMSDEA